MKAFIFLPFMFLAMSSVSSTQTLKTSVIKLEEDPEPALILERNNKANPQGGQKYNKQDDSNSQSKPGILILQGRPGYSNQPGKPWGFNQQGKPGVLNQPGGLQGNSGESNQKGSSEISNEQGKPGSSSQQGKPGPFGQQGEPVSSSQQGKPGSASQQGKPGSSGKQGEPGSIRQQGKPGSSGQQGKPGLSSQQRKPRSFYNQEERKTVDNALDGNVEKQIGTDISKNQNGKTRCHSVYKPVCGSDGKTYGNHCVFNEAKRLSDGNLTLDHDGKC